MAMEKKTETKKEEIHRGRLEKGDPDEPINQGNIDEAVREQTEKREQMEKTTEKKEERTTHQPQQPQRGPSPSHERHGA